MRDQIAGISRDEEIYGQYVCADWWATILRAGLCPCIFTTALGIEVLVQKIIIFIILIANEAQ